MVDRLVTTSVIKPATTAIEVSGMNCIDPMNARTKISKYNPANFAKCLDAVSFALSRINNSLNLASDSALSLSTSTLPSASRLALSTRPSASFNLRAEFTSI